MKLDFKLSELEGLEFDGYQEALCDAFLVAGYTKDGRELNDEELDYINENESLWINEALYDLFY